MRKLVLGLIIVNLLLGTVVFAQEPIKIGVLVEFTGACAAYGQMGRDALELARAKGIVPVQVLGRPIELVYFDARTEPTGATNGATRLINTEKAVAIIGTMCSGPYLAAAEICQASGVPIIGPTTTNPLCTQVGDYCFRACFTDNDQGPLAASIAQKRYKAKTAAVVIDMAQAYCVGLGQFFMDAFKALGGKIVAELYCRSGDVDYTAQLTEIQRKNPDIIYTPNYYTEVAMMARQARDLGMMQPILGADGLYAPELIKIGGDAVEGLNFLTFWSAEVTPNEASKKFVKEFRAKFGMDPDAFGALTVDCYMMIVDAIKRAGSANPAAIKQALKTSDLDVITGHVIMTPKNDPKKDFAFLTVKEGKFSLVETIPVEQAWEIRALIGK